MTEYTVKNLSQQEFLKIEKQFFTVDRFDMELSDDIFKVLHDFFSKKERTQIEVYKNTYWKIFVFLTWENMTTQREEDIDEICSYQIVDAYRLGFDVFEKLMWYFTLNTLQPKSQQRVYNIMKQSFFNSSYVVGTENQSNVTIKDLVNQIIVLNNQKNDSIKVAEFKGRLKKILFPQNNVYSTFLPDVSNDASDKFFDLVHFFIGVEVKGIGYIIDLFLQRGKNKDNALLQTISQDVQETSIEPPQQIEITPATPTPQQIQAQIESTYTKDQSGNFEDLEGVFGELHQLADQYNDPSIAELLYFDENSGEFLWNQET